MSAAEILAAKMDELIAEVRALRRAGEGATRPMVSRAEAAKRLGKRREWIAAMIAAGKLQVVQDGGRGKIRVADLDRLVESGDLGPRRRGRPRKARAKSDDTPISDWKPS